MKFIKFISIYFLHLVGATIQNTKGFYKRIINPSNADDRIVFEKEIKSNKIAIFASFQKYYSFTLASYLNELKNQGFDIVFVSNSYIGDEFSTALKETVTVAIQRLNLGRDFGAYRSGFIYLYNKRPPSLDNILITNDTLIFPIIDSSNFWSLIESSTADAVGAFESYTPKYHLQSYFILLKNKIWEHEIFKKYWANYQLFDSRRHAIKNGEIGFSRLLNKCNAKFDSIFSLNNSAEYSNQLINSHNTYWINNYDDLYEISQIFQHNSFANIRVLRYLENSFERSNPSHSLAFSAVALNIIPFLKKDLISAGSYTLTQVSFALDNIISSIDKLLIIKELKSKGMPSEFKISDKVQKMLGMK